MLIRNYQEKDEQGWVRCRVISFLDCSYYNDVLRKKEMYQNESICLVAEDKGLIVGLIDVELESKAGDICSVKNNSKGAVIWHLAVLPEYRRQHVAKQLWEQAKRQLINKNIRYCEVWTQEDEAANRWYISQDFKNINESNWLRCYAKSSKTDWFLNSTNVGKIYGVEEMIFDVEVDRRDEVKDYCYRIDEVRLYAMDIK